MSETTNTFESEHVYWIDTDLLTQVEVIKWCSRVFGKRGTNWEWVFDILDTDTDNRVEFCGKLVFKHGKHQTLFALHWANLLTAGSDNC